MLPPLNNPIFSPVGIVTCVAPILLPTLESSAEENAAAETFKLI